MEILNKIKQKPVEAILIIPYMVIFVIIVIFKDTCLDLLASIPNTICREIIRLILIIPYCAFVIPEMFSSVLDSKNVSKCYYHGIHLAYLLLPIGLIWRNVELGLTLLLVMTLLVSLIMACCIYRKIKQKKEIKFLKYSNLVVSTLFTIVCLLLDSVGFEINIKILLFSVSLLMMLQVVYEKIDLERKEIKCDTPESERVKSSNTVEKEQIVGNKERGNNATVSGAICVNLKLEI